MTSKEKKALHIVTTLVNKGYKSYYAGGCVRDKILKRPSKDIDIVTSATPEQVMNLFLRTVAIGQQFGVVMVIIGNDSFEVATFRRDEDYHDGRHPTQVVYSDEIEDAFRRDFTMNGMFYNPLTNTMLDYVDGQRDIQKQLIRTIGCAEKRFDEDKLRMLRCIRFAARFNYHIDDDAWNCIQREYSKISLVSMERIVDELFKIFSESFYLKGIHLLFESQMFLVILPECATVFHQKNGHSYKYVIYFLSLIQIYRLPEFVFACLLYWIKWQNRSLDVNCILQRFKLSKKTVHFILNILSQVECWSRFLDMRLADKKRLCYCSNVWYHLELYRMWCVYLDQSLHIYQFAFQWCQDFKKRNPNRLRSLITGDDLIRIGLKPSSRFKTILYHLETAQLEDKFNNKQQAMDYTRQNLSSLQIETLLN